MTILGGAMDIFWKHTFQVKVHYLANFGFYELRLLVLHPTPSQEGLYITHCQAPGRSLDLPQHSCKDHIKDMQGTPSP